MPKDDANAHHPHPPTHTAPLKRGDACLYCRKRRIKCSADKPTCTHCQKLGRECVYDAGKPVSRVKQLEDKVAQLENLLTRSGTASSAPAAAAATGAPGPNSGSGIGSTSASPPTGTEAQHPPPLIHHSSSEQTVDSVSSSASGPAFPLPTQSGMHQPTNSSTAPSIGAGLASFDYVAGTPFSLDINMLEGLGEGPTCITPGFLANFGGSMLGGTDANMASGLGTSTGFGQPTAESLFDFSLLDPEYTSLLSSFSATSTAVEVPYIPPVIPQQQPLQSQMQNGFGTQTPLQQQQPQSQPYAQPLPQQQQQTSSSTPYSLLASSSNQSPADQDTLDAMDMFMVGQPSETPFQTNSFYSQQPMGMVGPNAGVPGVIPHSEMQSALSSRPQTQASATSNSVPYHAYVTSMDKEPSLNNSIPGQASAPLRPNPNSLDPRPGNPQQWIFGVTDSSGDAEPAGVGTTRSIPTAERTAESETFTLVGGWFDAADLPKVARDHLLDLFFGHMRMFGQEFHIPRFYASLGLPPAKRPHPCLMYSMYLLASRISTSPPIRALEQHFYSIACKQLDESIGRADRLLDATRAATILAAYKYSLARYHEGWMMTGQAARLAVSCGLHQIKSSVFKPSTVPSLNVDLMGMMRHRVYCLPPAKDAIEHAERIWAFWSIFTCDRAGSISSQWPPAMPDEIITTPYPKPFFEYEVGMVSEADDVSIASLYNPSLVSRPLPHYADSTTVILRMKALAILERSSKLMYLPAEAGWAANLPQSASASSSPPGGIDEYLASQGLGQTFEVCLDGPGGNNWGSVETATGADEQAFNGKGGAASSSTSFNGWTRTAKIRTPKAYEEVRQALLRVELDMPTEWRVDWHVWDGKVQEWHFSHAPRKDLITLHFVLGCAWMFLFDVFAFNAENTSAVNVARRLTYTVKNLGKEVMTSEIDVFIAMTWSFISKILIREVKRLQSIGDTVGAQAIEADVETIVQALKVFGQRYTISAMQAMRAERYRKSTWDDVKFMQKDGHESD